MPSSCCRDGPVLQRADTKWRVPVDDEHADEDREHHETCPTAR